MSKDRFTPAVGLDRAVCLDCGFNAKTDKDMREHLSTSEKGKRSHRMRIITRTREEMIQTAVRQEVEDAIQRGLEDLYRLEDDGVTSAEIRKALTWHQDFLDAYEENEQ